MKAAISTPIKVAVTHTNIPTKKVPLILYRKNQKVVIGPFYLRYQNTQIMKNQNQNHKHKQAWYNQIMKIQTRIVIKQHKKLRTTHRSMKVTSEKKHSTSITQRCRNLQTYEHQKKAKHGSQH